MPRDIVPKSLRLSLVVQGDGVLLRSGLRLVVGNAPYLEDPDACAQVVSLIDLDTANPEPGADLRPEAYRIAGHPGIRAWLDASEKLLSRAATRPEFRRKQRHGVLRILAGTHTGFPLATPPYAAILQPGQVIALGTLPDEMERYPLVVSAPTEKCPYPKPEKQRYNCTEARAFLGWKFDRLEKLVREHPHIPTGRIRVEGSRGLYFKADDFAKWAWSLPD